VRRVLQRLSAMRAYMRAVNLGDPPDESVASAAGLTGAEVTALYRLLAVAK
jgi:nitrate reductase beta subunit